MAKYKINKLPPGYVIRDGKVVRAMQSGGHITGDQLRTNQNFSLVTIPPLNADSSSKSMPLSPKMRYSLTPVPRDEANIEAERGETVLTDLDGDGQFELYDITGKRHTGGGTPLNLPPQSFIYSDTAALKLNKVEMSDFGELGKKRLTPAKISKKFDLNTYIGYLSDPSADYIRETTSDLMLQKNKESLSKLAFVQESKKEFSDGVPLASHAFLQSEGVDPVQFTMEIEDKQRREAEDSIIAQMPPEEQQQMEMMRAMMEQEKQQMAAQEQPQGQPQGQPEQMPMARYGGQPCYNCGGSTSHKHLRKAKGGQGFMPMPDDYDPEWWKKIPGSGDETKSWPYDNVPLPETKANPWMNILSGVMGGIGGKQSGNQPQQRSNYLKQLFNMIPKQGGKGGKKQGPWGTLFNLFLNKAQANIAKKAAGGEGDGTAYEFGTYQQTQDNPHDIDAMKPVMDTNAQSVYNYGGDYAPTVKVNRAFGIPLPTATMGMEQIIPMIMPMIQDKMSKDKKQPAASQPSVVNNYYGYKQPLPKANEGVADVQPPPPPPSEWRKNVDNNPLQGGIEGAFSAFPASNMWMGIGKSGKKAVVDATGNDALGAAIFAPHEFLMQPRNKKPVAITGKLDPDSHITGTVAQRGRELPTYQDTGEVPAELMEDFKKWLPIFLKSDEYKGAKNQIDIKEAFLSRFGEGAANRWDKSMAGYAATEEGATDPVTSTAKNPFRIDELKEFVTLADSKEEQTQQDDPLTTNIKNYSTLQDEVAENISSVDEVDNTDPRLDEGEINIDEYETKMDATSETEEVEEGGDEEWVNATVSADQRSNLEGLGKERDFVKVLKGMEHEIGRIDTRKTITKKGKKVSNPNFGKAIATDQSSDTYAKYDGADKIGGTMKSGYNKVGIQALFPELKNNKDLMNSANGEIVRMMNLNSGYDPRVAVAIAQGLIPAADRRKYWTTDNGKTPAELDINKVKGIDLSKADPGRVYEEITDIYKNTYDDLGRQKDGLLPVQYDVWKERMKLMSERHGLNYPSGLTESGDFRGTTNVGEDGTLTYTASTNIPANTYEYDKETVSLFDASKPGSYDATKEGTEIIDEITSVEGDGQDAAQIEVIADQKAEEAVVDMPEGPAKQKKKEEYKQKVVFSMSGKERTKSQAITDIDNAGFESSAMNRADYDEGKRLISEFEALQKPYKDQWASKGYKKGDVGEGKGRNIGMASDEYYNKLNEVLAWGKKHNVEMPDLSGIVEDPSNTGSDTKNLYGDRHANLDFGLADWVDEPVEEEEVVEEEVIAEEVPEEEEIYDFYGTSNPIDPEWYPQDTNNFLNAAHNYLNLEASDTWVPSQVAGHVDPVYKDPTWGTHAALSGAKQMADTAATSLGGKAAMAAMMKLQGNASEKVAAHQKEVQDYNAGAGFKANMINAKLDYMVGKDNAMWRKKGFDETMLTAQNLRNANAAALAEVTKMGNAGITNMVSAANLSSAYPYHGIDSGAGGFIRNDYNPGIDPTPQGTGDAGMDCYQKCMQGANASADICYKICYKQQEQNTNRNNDVYNMMTQQPHYTAKEGGETGSLVDAYNALPWMSAGITHPDSI